MCSRNGGGEGGRAWCWCWLAMTYNVFRADSRLKSSFGRLAIRLRPNFKSTSAVKLYKQPFSKCANLLLPIFLPGKKKKEERHRVKICRQLTGQSDWTRQRHDRHLGRIIRRYRPNGTFKHSRWTFETTRMKEENRRWLTRAAIEFRWRRRRREIPRSCCDSSRAFSTPWPALTRRWNSTNVSRCGTWKYWRTREGEQKTKRRSCYFLNPTERVTGIDVDDSTYKLSSDRFNRAGPSSGNWVNWFWFNFLE